MTKITRKSGLIIFLTALLSGCGGGGSGDAAPALAPAPAPAAPPTTGIEGSGVALGTISGFGSVIVNGVRYNTDSAQITIDGEDALESDLSIGDVVVVIGSIDDDGVNGTAESVRLDHLLEGPIASIDTAANTFVVFGQTVLVDGDTVFDDGLAGFDALAVDQRVEVSGFFGSDGSIIATRIEEGDVNDDLELSGIVSALDTGASTFEINGQVVDFSAAVLEDFPADGIADGLFVEVYASGIDSNDRLTATRVENYDEFDDFDDFDELEIEGVVSRFASATDFDVAGLPVTTTSDTEFENGSASDLALDVRLEVEGELDDSGVLVADDIEFLAPPDVELEGPVEAVDSTSLTVLGVAIFVDGRTSFEDNSDSDVTSFGLDDIRVGDYVEVRAVETNAGLLARRIERDDAEDDDNDGNDDTSLTGTVDSVMEPTLVVLGVTIETDAQTEFFDDDGLSITAAEFFAAISPGSVVEVEGETISAGVILAEEIELEDADEDDD